TVVGTTVGRRSTSTEPDTPHEKAPVSETARPPVAIDAMGGDRAPAEMVLGARRARDELGVEVVLVGRAEEIGDTDGIEVIEASEVIPMDADPGRAVRTMKDSSLVRAAEAVRDGN